MKVSFPWMSLAAVTVLFIAVIIGCSGGATSTKPKPASAPAAASAKAMPVKRATSEPNTVAEYLARATELRVAYLKPPSEWPKPTLDEGVVHREIGQLPKPTFPADNSYTKDKEELGRQLFFDPRLSGSGQIACASCHDPDLAWADGRTVSFGHNRAELRRNSPSIFLSAYRKRLFWDGRAQSLEQQFASPVAAHDEMNGERQTIEKRLDAIAEYRRRFKEVFNADHVSLDDAARAVATFERALGSLGGRSGFDKFLGGQSKALSDSAVRGLHVFRTSGRCMNCHSGPMFSDDDFHDLGLSYYGRKLQDLGRYNITKDSKDVGRFLTPSLRNVGRTGPYMHNGIFQLSGVIAAYNAGMATLTPTTTQASDPLFPKKDHLLKRLGLGSLEREDLQAFLESLNEPPLRIRPPALPGKVVSAEEKPLN